MTFYCANKHDRLSAFWNSSKKQSSAQADKPTPMKQLNAAIDDKEDQLQHCIEVSSLMPKIIDGLMAHIAGPKVTNAEYKLGREQIQKFLEECDKISSRVPELTTRLDHLKMVKQSLHNQGEENVAAEEQTDDRRAEYFKGVKEGWGF
jgi:hypothetical protein